MKIGIYGDSFASYSGNSVSWVEHLQDRSLDIENWGVGGTSNFFSYKNFVNSHHFYDVVIFLATSYHRTNIRNMEISTVGPTQLELCIKDEADMEKKMAIKAALDWQLFAQDREHAYSTQKLELSEIRRLRPDALIIPCFPGKDVDVNRPRDHSRTYVFNDFEGSSMWDISLLDYTFFKIKDWNLADLRTCHLNEHNNFIFSQKIFEWIQNKKKFIIDINDFKNPSLPIEHYFK